MPELFELGDDMMVDINREWISTIPEFNKILRRDRGSDGDAQGRKKLQAKKEFSYIYHLCDYRSSYENYSESERHRESLRNAELPPDFKPDAELQAAIDKYNELKVTESIRVVRTLKQTLSVTRKIATSVINRMEAFLGEMENEESLLQTSAELVDGFSRISRMIKDLPQMISAISDLETTIKNELAQGSSLRAGAQKGVEEEP